ncbi:MAG: hypothetical protein HS110_04020 [Zoogloeaceae bacterium]|nr:hypothetical protein [Zoogloeaceae bacterium]
MGKFGQRGIDSRLQTGVPVGPPLPVALKKRKHIAVEIDQCLSGSAAVVGLLLKIGERVLQPVVAAGQPFGERIQIQRQVGDCLGVRGGRRAGDSRYEHFRLQYAVATRILSEGDLDAGDLPEALGNRCSS